MAGDASLTLNVQLAERDAAIFNRGLIGFYSWANSHQYFPDAPTVIAGARDASSWPQGIGNEEDYLLGERLSIAFASTPRDGFSERLDLEGLHKLLLNLSETGYTFPAISGGSRRVYDQKTLGKLSLASTWDLLLAVRRDLATQKGGDLTTLFGRAHPSLDALVSCGLDPALKPEDCPAP